MSTSENLMEKISQHLGGKPLISTEEGFEKQHVPTLHLTEAQTQAIMHSVDKFYCKKFCLTRIHICP